MKELNINSWEYHAIMGIVIKMQQELDEKVKERVVSKEVKIKDERYRLPVPLRLGYLGLEIKKDVP